jgi:hypothetical protein
MIITAKQGSVLVRNEEGADRWPLIVKNNVFILPGVPQYCREKFALTRADLMRQPFYVAKVFVNDRETNIAGTLTALDNTHAQVDIGSYPILDNPSYQVVVTLESKDQYALSSCLSQLQYRLASSTIVKVEASTPDGLLKQAASLLSSCHKGFSQVFKPFRMNIGGSKEQDTGAEAGRFPATERAQAYLRDKVTRHDDKGPKDGGGGGVGGGGGRAGKSEGKSEDAPLPEAGYR